MNRMANISGVCAAIALTGWASTAQAQSVVYTFRGTVTSVPPAPHPWSGLVVGDPFAVAMRARQDLPPSSSTPTSRTYQFTHPAYVSMGPHVIDLLYGWIGADRGEVLIANDDGPSPVSDHFGGSWPLTDGADLGGELTVAFHETAPTPPVITALSGLDWPDAAELDVSTWDSATMRLTLQTPDGTFTATAAIETVRIQTLDCWEIDFNFDDQIDFADYLVFLNYFDAGDTRADLCGCGIVDFMSYLIFLDRYDTCPQ